MILGRIDTKSSQITQLSIVVIILTVMLASASIIIIIIIANKVRTKCVEEKTMAFDMLDDQLLNLTKPGNII